MNVLVIAPHPDDEVLGCGGVMACHAAAGDQVHVLILTRGIPELYPAEEIERTRAELRKAHALLGVTETQFLDLPAPKLIILPRHEIADAIGRAIREVHAEVVYMPHRNDLHTDHQVAYHATLIAARPIDHCPVRRLLCYETLSETEWGSPLGADAFVPTVFIDISDYLDTKLQAMACFESQLKPPPHSRSLQAIEAQARLRGALVSFEAAEAFMLVREVVT